MLAKKDVSRIVYVSCHPGSLARDAGELVNTYGYRLEQVGVMDEPNVQVQRLAELAKRSGMDGVVCSAREATMLKEACGRQFELITPGIRPAGADAGDQRRVLTPVQARDAGVDYMVIGRPITQAAEPTAVVDEILQSLA